MPEALQNGPSLIEAAFWAVCIIGSGCVVGALGCGAAEVLDRTASMWRRRRDGR